MKRLIIFLFLLNFAGLCEPTNNTKIKIAVLGLGERANSVLLDCLKLSEDIRVVAVCDDNFDQSLAFFCNKLSVAKDPLLATYKKIFDGAAIYRDNQTGLIELLKHHKDVDRIFITSANYKHARDLNAVITHSPCKKIYLEKPIFKDIDEWSSFNMPDQNVQILIGLTLRYSSMAKIVVEQLQTYKEELGQLLSVKAFESIRFNQGVGPFMMSWRRYRSLSGGFLLEKCIHDLDLALFFIETFGIKPHQIDIQSHADHKIFKKSNKQHILDEIAKNDALNNSLLQLRYWQYQPYIQIYKDENNNVMWNRTFDEIFKDLPDNDNFTSSDIIPDYHVLHAVIKDEQNASINFELEVECRQFALNTLRNMKFVFNNGYVIVDVMKSIMSIHLNNGQTHEIDLRTNNSDHADGDTYIAKAILGLTENENYIATINDEIVQLASVMGLVSEFQVAHHQTTSTRIVHSNNTWHFE